MKDYYQILGLEPGATEGQIRKAYRRLALQYHPDHNPDDPRAEERFKEVAEAYAVLMDPGKRSRYEHSRQAGRSNHTGRGFGYSQEEIFRDLFQNQRFHPMFADLFREFERAGFRFDPRFFEQTFFGQRGGSGDAFFYKGPFNPGRHQPRPPRPAPGRIPQLPAWKKLLKSWGEKLGRALGIDRFQPDQPTFRGAEELDLTYELVLDQAEGRRGGWVQIAVNRGTEQENLRVRIPAGIPSGRRLRLKGKGISRGPETGDLYLTVHLRESLV